MRDGASLKGYPRTGNYSCFGRTFTANPYPSPLTAESDETVAAYGPGHTKHVVLWQRNGQAEGLTAHFGHALEKGAVTVGRNVHPYPPRQYRIAS